MQRAIQETERRRKIQEQFNREMGITPETVRSNIKDILSSIYEADYWTVAAAAEEQREYGYDDVTLKNLEAAMKEAARNLEFEKAAVLRDRMKAIRSRMIEVGIKG
jgi:excinuclease ABC subunit B